MKLSFLLSFARIPKNAGSKLAQAPLTRPCAGALSEGELKFWSQKKLSGRVATLDFVDNCRFLMKLWNCSKTYGIIKGPYSILPHTVQQVLPSKQPSWILKVRTVDLANFFAH